MLSKLRHHTIFYTLLAATGLSSFSAVAQTPYAGDDTVLWQGTVLTFISRKPIYEYGETIELDYKVDSFEWSFGDTSRDRTAVFSMDAFHRPGPYERWFSKKIPMGSSGTFSLPSTDFYFYESGDSALSPYRAKAYTGLEMGNRKLLFYVSRPIKSAPNGLMHLEKSSYQAGEEIRVNVSGNIDEFTKPYINPKSDTERANLRLVRLPREVPGGAWIPPTRYHAFNDTGFYMHVKKGGGSYALLSTSTDNAGSSNMGTVPPGHYAVYLSIDDVIIDEARIEITVPERESLKVITLSPTPDDENKKTPVFDTLPKIGIDAGALSPEMLRYGVMRLFRVGRHNSLRFISEREVDCGAGTSCNIGDDWDLFTGQGGVRYFGRAEGDPLMPGTYEARFYYRRTPLGYAFDEWDFVLDSQRFTITKDALDDQPQNAQLAQGIWWETRAEPIPEKALELKASKQGPLQMGEIVQVDITDGEAAKDMDTPPWDAMKEDVWVSLHRVGGYTIGCAYYEESAMPATNVVQLKEAAPVTANLGNGIGIPSFNVPAFNVPTPAFPDVPAVPMQDASGDPVIAPSNTTGQSRPFVVKLGDRRVSLAMPPVPGRYELRLYRGKVAHGKERFPDGELLASRVFDVEAAYQPGAIQYSSPQQDMYQPARLSINVRKQSDILSNYSLEWRDAREIVSGGAEILPRWDSRVGGLASTAQPADAASSYNPAARYGANADQRNAQAFIMSNGMVVSSSQPARFVNNQYEGDPWPDELIPQTKASYADLVVPVNEWLLPESDCAQPNLPDHKLRIVEWIPGEPDEQAEYDNSTFELVDGKDDEYKVLDEVYFGFPFFIEAVFDTAPDAEEFYGKAGNNTRVHFKRTEENPTIFRSEDMYIVTEEGIRKAS